MERTLNDAWGGLAFRGMLAVVFGIAAVFWPGLTLETLVYLFGGFILASGLLGLVWALANVYNPASSVLSRVLSIGLGVGEIAVGVYLLRHPEVSFNTLILLIAFALIVRGVIDFAAGLFEEGGAMHRTVMLIGGLIAAVVGVVLLFQDEVDGVAFVWILGLYALVTGPLMIALALDMKNQLLTSTNGRSRR